MENNNNLELPSLRKGFLLNQDDQIKPEKLYMGNRVCDNCGKTKDTSGAKTCSHGHFICHHCASYHVHCPLCGHTLR